ncbi:MAG: hypothetical protein KH029_01190 [Haemophilus parainfluenzae]|nr:hypothetical protein [Haemophilus parainfluenzae]
MIAKNKYLISLFIIIYLGILAYGVLSGGISKNYTRKQEGERLYTALNLQFKDKIQYQNVDFRYVKISLRLLGELRDYKDFVSKRGYSEIRENVYCKNGNLITLHHNFPNIEFQYEYDSSVCK